MRQYVAVILVKSDGSVLAQHRDNKVDIIGPDTWGAVGGTRDNGDANLKETGCRELLEETDYKIKPGELRFLARDTYTTEKGTEVERTIFWAMYDDKQEIYTNEGQEIRFLSPSELNGLIIYAGHEGFLKKASAKVFRSPIEKE